jgi:neopullulanase
VYYGDEIGLEGAHDPDNRRAFPWHQPGTWDNDLLHEFQKMIALRHASPALRRGSYTVLHASDDVFAHARRFGDETVVVVFNVARATRRVDLPLGGLAAGLTGLDEVWGRGEARVEGGSLLSTELAPRSARVFRRTAP